MNITINSLMANIGDQFKLGDGGPSVNTFTTLNQIVSPLISNLFVIAGLIFLFLLIAGGISYIIRSGNPEEMQKGQGALTSALLGFIIVFTAYWIVQIFQFITGVKIFDTNL